MDDKRFKSGLYCLLHSSVKRKGRRFIHEANDSAPLVGLLAGLCTVSVLSAAAREQEFEPAQPESIVLERAAIPAMKEIYRLYNPNDGDYHYTMNTYERDGLIRAGWRDEGIGGIQ